MKEVLSCSSSSAGSPTPRGQGSHVPPHGPYLNERGVARKKDERGKGPCLRVKTNLLTLGEKQSGKFKCLHDVVAFS